MNVPTKRRTSAEVRGDKVQMELARVHDLLGQVAGFQRFLLAERLIDLGHAKDLREAIAIIKDKPRLDTIFASDAPEKDR